MADITGHLPATTVNPPPPPEVLIDQLSGLPEPLLLKILSLLPTHLAVQTSRLSSRFRHLWSASPSLYFDRRSFSGTTRFVKMVDSALLRHDLSAPLESLSIISCYAPGCCPPRSRLKRWITDAGCQDVRHLLLEIEASIAAKLCLVFFSIKSLESLHISPLEPFMCPKALMPPDIISTRLKSLYFSLNMDLADLTRPTHQRTSHPGIFRVEMH